MHRRLLAPSSALSLAIVSSAPVSVAVVSVAVVSIGLLGCESKTSVVESETPADGVVRRGEPLAGAPEKSLSEILSAPKSFEGQTIKTTGAVRKACSQKGCWMELAESNAPEAAGCRITFKDYGFFVPLDSAGSSATLEGEVQLQKVPKKHVDHYEAEGAAFKDKNADGSANEVRIVATGVELRR